MDSSLTEQERGRTGGVPSVHTFVLSTDFRLGSDDPTTEQSSATVHMRSRPFVVTEAL